jgi:nitrate/nitrite transport system permease protein
VTLLTDSTEQVEVDSVAVLDPPPSPAPRSAKLDFLKRWASTLGWGSVGILVLLSVWAFIASRVPSLATPQATFDELTTLAQSAFYSSSSAGKGIGLQLLSSLQRVFYGFALAAVVGIPVGLALGCSKRAFRAANPVVQLLRPVSPLAWFPIWLIIFKNAPQAAIWVIFITALWPIILNTASGASMVPIAERNVSRVFHFGRLTYLRRVVVPVALPSIVTGLRLSMGVAWMVIVAVEMLSGGTGIGFFVWDQYNALNMPALLAAIVLIGIVGLLLDIFFLWLARRVTVEETI